MKLHYSQLVKTKHANESVREILESPITILVGVDEEDAAALAHLNIHSVYDLAASRVFNLAREITMAANDDRSAMAAYGFAPKDATTATEKMTFDDLAAGDIKLLPGIGEQFDDDIQEAIALQTVRDFSLWPPFLAARSILSSLTGDSEERVDDETPPELVPVARQYATEKVFYPKIFIDQISDSASTTEPEELNKKIDISGTDRTNYGFKEPALGALLVFSQSWYPEGLSLGNLLHSMTLAPGESTNLAVVDWARSTASQTDEDIDQTESLAASMSHNRAVSEVQTATAREFTSGQSRVTGSSMTSEAGAAAGGILGGLFGGGVSAGMGTSTTNSTTVSSSSGRRDIAAEMSQNVRDITQQQASSSRSRRASLVYEASEKEREEVSTRTVTNYNHMHPLNMHYYEVVQIYRASVRPESADPVLFLPFEELDFSDERVIVRHRRALRHAALDEYTRSLLTKSMDRLTLTRTLPITADLAEYYQDTQFARPGTFVRHDEVGIEGAMMKGIWNLPANTELVGLEYYSLGTQRTPASVDIFLEDGESPIHISEFTDMGPVAIHSLSPARPLARVGRLEVTLKPNENTNLDQLYLVLQLRVDGKETYLTVGGQVNSTADRVSVFTVSPPTDIEELSQILTDDRLYYSQAIWRTLDPQEIILLLEPYQFEGRRVAEIIEPVALATHGNYVGFKLSIPDNQDNPDDDITVWWDEWLERNFTDRISEDLVALPTGGIHGEAILGRANAAEKLDITRFWDWQESPIPFAPPQIAPVQTGQQKPTEPMKPGSLDAPIINIQTPSALPDPAGLSAVLNTLSTANLFRDMSGLDAAAAIAQHGQTITGEGASNAATLAAQNYQTAAQVYIESLKAALSLLAASQGIPVGAVGGSNSSFGGLLNKAKELDGKASKPAGSGRNTTPSSGAPVGSDGNGGGSLTGGETGGPTPSPSNPDELQRRGVASRLDPIGSVDVSIGQPHIISRTPSVPPVQSLSEKITGQTVESKMLLADFDIDSDALKLEHREALDNLKKLVGYSSEANRKLGRIILIEGRASKSGSNKHNLELSERRAEKVKEYLLSGSSTLSESDINLVRGVGEDQPLSNLGKFEDPSERSVLVEYLTTVGAPTITDPGPTLRKSDHGLRNWSIRFKLNPKVEKDLWLPIASMDVQIKNKTTDKVLTGRIAMGGPMIGISAISSMKSKEWTNWIDIQTVPLQDEEWDGRIFTMVRIGAGAYVGGAESFHFSFPGIIEEDVMELHLNEGSVGAFFGGAIGQLRLESPE